MDATKIEALSNADLYVMLLETTDSITKAKLVDNACQRIIDAESDDAIAIREYVRVKQLTLTAKFSAKEVEATVITIAKLFNNIFISGEETQK